MGLHEPLIIPFFRLLCRVVLIILKLLLSGKTSKNIKFLPEVL